MHCSDIYIYSLGPAGIGVWNYAKPTVSELVTHASVTICFMHHCQRKLYLLSYKHISHHITFREAYHFQRWASLPNPKTKLFHLKTVFSYITALCKNIVNMHHLSDVLFCLNIVKKSHR